MAKKTDPRLDVLQSVPLFEGFTRKELAAVGDLVREEWFNAGDDIVTQGEAGDRFYIVLEGRAKVITNGRTRQTLGPGNFFGEMSLIDPWPRSATVRADTNVKALWIGRLRFIALLAENWKMTQKVLAELCTRLRATGRNSA